MKTVESHAPGALVLSLDFELWWGVRERHAGIPQVADRLLGARRVVRELLELFEEFEVAATWATVGFLFAESREDVQRSAPSIRAAYRDSRLSPYGDAIGSGEDDDPFRLAPSLVKAIQRAPRQELATHTFSHYYCGEAGNTREAFAADLGAACAIADRYGVRLRSIVFPRNQHNPDYDDLLLAHGIRAYRGNPRTESWDFSDTEQSRRPWKRLSRLADAYVGGDADNTISWADVPQPSGLSDVRASGILRPYRPALRYLEKMRLDRMRRSLRKAGRGGRILHLWWHPHNFGPHPRENLAFLRALLTEFAECRERYGMLSLAMAEVDERVRSESPAVGEKRDPGTAPGPRLMSQEVGR